MTTSELSHFIRLQAADLGFSACGFAAADALPEIQTQALGSWLNASFHGEMSYMERNSDKRSDPRLLVEGCRSLIVVALNYFPSVQPCKSAPKIARFAYGKDYHPLIRSRLYQLLDRIREQGIQVSGRAFADSAPIMERYWAWKAGLGWIGKNQQLIIPKHGSYFLLGELLIDLELDYDQPLENLCGKCTNCLKSCPTKALNGICLDARQCLSYLTIEKKGDFSSYEAEKVGENHWIFGCDLCQEACPWNRFSMPNETVELQPTEKFLQMSEADFKNLTEESFSLLFKDTCIERTGWKGLMRNLISK